MPLLTVITPTHNSAEALRPLYESLSTQTIRDVQWIVADDGSTDTTRSLTEKFAAERRIDVHYIPSAGRGKLRAVINSISKARGKFTSVIEPGLILPEYAVEAVRDMWEEYYEGRYAGLLTLDCSVEDTDPRSPLDMTYFRSYSYPTLALGKSRRDLRPVVLTELMLRALTIELPEDEDEAPTDLLWLATIGDTPLSATEVAFCLKEYPTGWDVVKTDPYKPLRRAPRSHLDMYRRLATSKSIGRIDRIRAAAHALALSRLTGDPSGLPAALRLAAMPGSYLISRRLK